MQKRYLSIWFKRLLTDQLSIGKPDLQQVPLVIATKESNKLLVKYCNSNAQKQGISSGMTLADAKALVSGIVVENYEEGSEERLLREIATWCIRFSPTVALDAPNGLLLDITGCTHLWKGEVLYLKALLEKLKEKGYQTRGAIADTIGTAWAIARFGKEKAIIPTNTQHTALLQLTPAALRIDPEIVGRLYKLGMTEITDFIQLPRTVLRRRFGNHLILRLAQALGQVAEPISPIEIPEPYTERLPCLEPIRTAKAIELAIEQLLEQLCARLQKEGLGLRHLLLKGFRVDGEMVSISVGTHIASNQKTHLLKLLSMRISYIKPGLGIELFSLQASGIESVEIFQQAFWAASNQSDTRSVSELLDRIAIRAGKKGIGRYLPQAHHWPERALKRVHNLEEQISIPWPTHSRPTHLLIQPAPILVTAPIPDYPPLLFIYNGKRHDIKKADGPERIEREWWLESGEHRDYYLVEDAQGKRYWLFRSGHYWSDMPGKWFLHGFFA